MIEPDLHPIEIGYQKRYNRQKCPNQGGGILSTWARGVYGAILWESVVEASHMEKDGGKYGLRKS